MSLKRAVEPQENAKIAKKEWLEYGSLFRPLGEIVKSHYFPSLRSLRSFAAIQLPFSA